MTIKDPQAPPAPAKRSPQKRAKSWGYQVEVAALAALKPIFPNLRRTGSMAYKKAAADLLQESGQGVHPDPVIRLVVTRDKRHPLLVTMSVEDLDRIAGDWPFLLHCPVYVQVKGRERTWIGKLYDELKVATS